MRSLLNVRLAEARMTKLELARRTGISRSAIWNYSKDERIGRVRLGVLERIAGVLGCGVKDLFEE